MKIVTKREAAKELDALGELALTGETVVVTNYGKPWIRLVSASKPMRGKSAAAFKARLGRISSKPIPGVAQLLGRLRR